MTTDTHAVISAADLTIVGLLAPQVDRLGSLRAEIKVLQEEAKEIEDTLIDRVPDRTDGSIFTALVVRSHTKTVNWKAIATKLNASRQMILGNTKLGSRAQVRVTAFAKKAAA
jgi:hypothetical protein